MKTNTNSYRRRTGRRAVFLLPHVMAEIDKRRGHLSRPAFMEWLLCGGVSTQSRAKSPAYEVHNGR